MPSSLVTSTRALRRLSGFLAIGADRLQPAEVGPQRLRHGDAAVGLLVVLHDGDEAAADRHAGAVQGVHEAGAFSTFRPEARLHAARLEVAAVRAARDLAVGGLAGQPDRSEEHTSELQSLMRISYAVFCL